MNWRELGVKAIAALLAVSFLAVSALGVLCLSGAGCGMAVAAQSCHMSSLRVSEECCPRLQLAAADCCPSGSQNAAAEREVAPIPHQAAARSLTVSAWTPALSLAAVAEPWSPETGAITSGRQRIQLFGAFLI